MSKKPKQPVEPEPQPEMPLDGPSLMYGSYASNELTCDKAAIRREMKASRKRRTVKVKDQP